MRSIHSGTFTVEAAYRGSHAKELRRVKLTLLLLVVGSSCLPRGAPVTAPSAAKTSVDTEVYTNLAMAFVVDDWQTDDNDRGHNIGVVLDDSEGRVIAHALNSRYATGDSTQHAEVRLIQDGTGGRENGRRLRDHQKRRPPKAP